MRKKCKRNAKEIQKLRNPKEMQNKCKINAKLMQKKCKRNAKEMQKPRNAKQRRKINAK